METEQQYVEFLDNLKSELRFNGNYCLLGEYLKKGLIDPNKHLEGVEGLLYFCVRNRLVIATELLLKYGADPNYTNSDNKTCLEIAVVGGSIDIVFLLLSFGAKLKPEDTATMLLAINLSGDLVIKELIKAGGSLSYKKPYSQKNEEIYYGQLTPLYKALRNNKSLEYIKTLLKLGAIDNCELVDKYYNPILYALNNNRTEVVEEIIKYAKEIDYKLDLNIKCILGYTPKSNYVFRLLLENGLDLSKMFRYDQQVYLNCFSWNLGRLKELYPYINKHIHTTDIGHNWLFSCISNTPTYFYLMSDGKKFVTMLSMLLQTDLDINSVTNSCWTIYMKLIIRGGSNEMKIIDKILLKDPHVNGKYSILV